MQGGFVTLGPVIVTHTGEQHMLLSVATALADGNGYPNLAEGRYGLSRRSSDRPSWSRTCRAVEPTASRSPGADASR